MDIQINFEDIKDYKFALDEKYEVKITRNDLDFYFYFHLKSGSSQMIFFSNGALDLKKGVPPVYQRKSWSDEFSASTIYIDDRTLHDTKLVLGWGQGTIERYFLDDIADICREILKNLKLKETNTAFFGSSAGGFMSLVLASKVKGSTAIVNNPQTYVYNYLKGPVNSMFKVCYPGLERDEIIKRYNHRLSAVEAFKYNGYTPRVFYFQNKQCASDMENHFIPFSEEIEKDNEDINNVIYVLYNNEKLGHNPLPKDKTINWVIKQVANFSNEYINQPNNLTGEMKFTEWLNSLPYEELNGSIDQEKEINIGELYKYPNSKTKQEVAKKLPAFPTALSSQELKRIAAYFYSLYKPDYQKYKDENSLPKSYAYLILNLNKNEKASINQCREIIKMIDDHQKKTFKHLKMNRK
ncbi:hypothetical protein [Sporosarcina globispora]|uniref:hypothetical protein n=1 Tax=Sporosarcina globispora TaxID=1459 RepID=UPI0006A95E4D|nr:hypothetical protein [Sporosarcina globispora]